MLYRSRIVTLTITFLIDGMLGSLNRWLRICGYDTRFIQNAQDEMLLELAGDEDRVLLTRDRLLIRKALRLGQAAFLIEGESDAEKLASVSKRFGLDLETQMSRCSDCGGKLCSISREELKDKVSKGTFNAYEKFWVCCSCNKVYWKGSHWKNITNTIAEARQLIGVLRDNSEQDL